MGGDLVGSVAHLHYPAQFVPVGRAVLEDLDELLEVLLFFLGAEELPQLFEAEEIFLLLLREGLVDQEQLERAAAADPLRLTLQLGEGQIRVHQHIMQRLHVLPTHPYLLLQHLLDALVGAVELGEGRGAGEGERGDVLQLQGQAGGVAVELEVHGLVGLVEVAGDEVAGAGHLPQEIPSAASPERLSCCLCVLCVQISEHCQGQVAAGGRVQHL